MADKRITLLQKVFLSTDGTVTDLLALYSGGPIHARKVGQVLTDTPTGRVLHRQVLLENTNATPYVYAESQFMYDRFSAALQRDLIETETPIGMLWQRERLEMYREIVERKSRMDDRVATLLNVSKDTLIFSRTYRIHHGGAQIGEITENFAATMLR